MSDEVILKEGETISDLNLENRKWKNRRRMAYISLWGIILILILSIIDNSFATPERLKVAEGTIGWVLVGLTSIVVSYFGFNTLQSVMKKG